MIPPSASVALLGDGEFDGTGLQQTIEEADWSYVCREQGQERQSGMRPCSPPATCGVFARRNQADPPQQFATVAAGAGSTTRQHLRPGHAA